MAKDKLQTLADQLEQVMDSRAELEAQLQPIKDIEESIRAELLAAMAKKGYKSISATSGLGWTVVNGRVSHSIKKGMEAQAIEWATENYPSILSIAAPKLNKVVQPMLELPTFIERKQGEPYLSVRSNEDEAIMK